MASLNTNFKRLSKKIQLQQKHITETCETLTKFIQAQLDRRFTWQVVGSFALGTAIHRRDNAHAINIALIFKDLSGANVVAQKQKVYDVLTRYRGNTTSNPLVRDEEYRVVITFEDAHSNRKYHLAYSVHSHDLMIVKGKQPDAKLLEAWGGISFITEVRALKPSARNRFAIVTRLLKHCLHNGSDKDLWVVPSVVLTSGTRSFLTLDWNESSDLLVLITKVLQVIAKTIATFKLPFTPNDNPFDNLSHHQRLAVKSKLQVVIGRLVAANSETKDAKRWQLVNDLFPGLRKPRPVLMSTFILEFLIRLVGRY